MKHENNDRIAWHPAFFEAIQMELEEYSHNLQFISEYQLNTEPLRIDVVIIKKKQGYPYQKKYCFNLPQSEYPGIQKPG